MSKVSVIMPARKEPYIRETLSDLFENRAGDIEVILVLDGCEPDYAIPEYKGLRVIRNYTVNGRRSCTNMAASLATGKYIMKIDAHCSIGPEWDEILKADCDDNWIVIPRRYWLDVDNWWFKIDQNGNIGYVDAMSFVYPFSEPYKHRLTGRPDIERADRTANEDISEDMTFQGSCWFMHKSHFWNNIGGVSSYGYGTFTEEPEEIGLKTLLGPCNGKVIRNKRTWYAHWYKPKSRWTIPPEEAGRVTNEEREAGNRYSFFHWFYNKWEDRVHDIEWLIDKFWPLQGWPEDWKQQCLKLA